MELKYTFVIYLCIVPFILLFIRSKKKNTYKDGKKVASDSLIREEPYYKNKIRKYKAMKIVIQLSCFIAIIASLFLCARPYTTKVNIKKNYNRDIMLCIDCSSSVDELNLQLIKKYKETVKSLQGERFGIVIFNTSPILLAPLTSDYDYILNILDELEAGFKSNLNEGSDEGDWWYLYAYMTEGTLIGVDERGSSLIGDGLAACAYDFLDLEEKRTRVILFSTDNDLQGEPYLTTSEAASICKDYGIVVFGIAPKEMLSENKTTMKAAVEKTGGKFYIEEDSGTVKDIVADIEKQEKNMTEEGKEIIINEQPMAFFLILLISVSILVVSEKVLKI